MIDDFSALAAARKYLLETAPVLVLQLEGMQVVYANPQAIDLLGDQAVGRPFSGSLTNPAAPVEIGQLIANSETTHRLTFKSVSGLPETLYFRFFPLAHGTLALGSLDFQEQRGLLDQLLKLNGELNGLTRKLHQANAELREMNQVKSQFAQEMMDHNEALRRQSLASLNLMEDALAARERAEQANDALRTSGEQFRSLVEGAPDGIFVHSKLRYRYVNAAACQLFGANSPEELLDKPVFDRIHPDSRKLVQARIHKIRDEKEPAPPVEVKWLKLDGSTIFVDVSAVPISFEGEDGALVFARDMTERKRAQDALARSEQRYRGLLESAPDPLLAIDQGGRIILVNAEAERVFGYHRDQLLGQDVGIIIPAHLRPFPPSMLEQATRSPSPRGMEGQAFRKDGTEFPVEVRVSPIESGNNRVEIRITIRDLSGVKRAEAKFQKLLESAPDAIVVVNANREIVLVNQKAESMFGHPRGFMLGREVDLLLPERCKREYAKGSEACLADPAAGGEIEELFGVRATGTEFPIEVSLSPLTMEDGTLIFNDIRDVSERKEAEQRRRQLEITLAQAEAANKAKSLFLSTMSHEIRTPMNAILGYSQLMLRDPKLPAHVLAHLNVINRSGEHLLDIIDDVLVMAKIEAGRMQLVPKTFDICVFLLDLDAMFRGRAEAKAVQFDVRIAGEPVSFIVADEGKLRQVLVNLVGNAIKFTELGRIGLSVHIEGRDDGQLWLSAKVEDTGIGMTAEDQARLFRPFVQGEAGRQTQQGGTGLGLAISKGMVQLMGGDISVISAAGKGSIFRFEIPVKVGKSQDILSTSRHPRVLGLQAGTEAPRILIVDDAHDNREWLGDLLSSLGFSIRLAEDGKAAVRACDEWHPSLILMDVQMPVMDGLSATREIRSRPAGKDTVIIALTADVMDDRRRMSIESGMDDFISKPCLEGELLEKIRHHLGVSYINAPQGGAADSEPTPLFPSSEPSLENLNELPRNIVKQLREATLNGDKALLDGLLAALPTGVNRGTAQALQALADDYQYDRLIELFEGTCLHQQ